MHGSSLGKTKLVPHTTVAISAIWLTVCFLTVANTVWAQAFETPLVHESDVHVWGDKGDMDGDGDVDLVMIHDSLCPFSCPPRIKVWFNNGAGTFASSGFWEADGFSPFALHATVGDFDGDGFNDVAYTDRADIALRTNNHNGTFSYHSLLVTPSQLPPLWLGAGDVDNDGDTDLLYLDAGASKNLVLARNTGGASFVQEINSISLSSSSIVALGDVDNDGDLDLAVGETDQFSIWLYGADGSYSSHAQYPVPMAPALPHLADLDGNGSLDLVLGSNTLSGGTPYTQIWLNTGEGYFNYASALGDATPSSLQVGIGDYNDDQHLDIVIGHTATDELALWVNDGAAGFTFEGLYPAGVDPTVLVSADMDQDGQIDIVAQGGDDFSFVRNAGGDEPGPPCELDWNCDDQVTDGDRVQFLQDLMWYVTYHDTQYAHYVIGGYYHKLYCGHPGDLDWNNDSLINDLDYRDDNDPTYSSYLYEWLVHLYYPRWYTIIYPDSLCQP